MRRPRLRFGPFRVRAELGEVEAAGAEETGAEEPLSASDAERVEAEVRRMIADLRANPTQEKEDRVGIEIATLPVAERNLVPAILLRIVTEESGRTGAGQP